MKKFIIVAALLTLVGSPLMAAPSNDGVGISTMGPSSSNLLLYWGEGEVMSIHISSAQHLSGSDYFIIRDTYNVTGLNGGPGALGDTATTDEVYRLYTSSSDISGGILGTPTFGYTVNFNPPLPTRQGAAVKFNSSRQGLVTVIWRARQYRKPSGKPD